MFDDKTIEKNQSRMESARYGFDATRDELAALVLPSQRQFTRGMSNNGAPVTHEQLDEYAALALEDGVSAFEGFVIPRGQQWQNMTILDPELSEDVEVQQWLEAKMKLIFAMRNDPKSGFTNAVHSSAQSLFAFGEQSTWVDKRYSPSGRFVGLSYQSEHIGGIWVENDAEGSPMRIHRKFALSAEAAMLKWQEEAPPKVREAMSGQNPNPAAPFEFVHVIERNGRMMPGRIDAAGMPWRSGYYSCQDKAMFKAGGYRTLRRIVSRYTRSSGEEYGRGPAERVLPAIRASQLMMQDRMLATEMAVKPPLLARDDELDRSVIALHPDGITYGGLDEMGEPQLKTFYPTLDLSGAAELHGEVHAVIDKAFFRDLLQLNREIKTHISAARTLEEIGEKGVLLGPLARQEQEWFSPMLDAEIDCIWDEGFLDDMPQKLMEYFGRGHGVHVIYDNNLTRMQQASAAAGYLRTAEQVASIAQFDKSVIPAFTREYPLSKVVPGLGEVNGVPARWRATDAEKAAQDEQEQQSAALEQVLAAAPVLAQSAKDAAAAGAMGKGG